MVLVEINQSCSFRIDDKLTHILDAHLNQYRNAVNAYLQLIRATRAQYKRLSRDEQFEWKCLVCGKKIKIEYISTDGSEKYCGKCYFANYGDLGIRKKVTKKVRDYVTSLSKTECTMAHHDALQILKSIRGRERADKWLLNRLLNRQKMFTELRDDPKKRKSKSLGPRERVQKFCHADDIRVSPRYYSLSEIRREIKRLEKIINGVKRRLQRPPKLKRNIMTLHQNFIKFEGEDTVRLKVGNNWYSFNVTGEFQKRYFEIAKNRIAEGKKPTYPRIVKKRAGWYALEYTVTTPVDLPAPNLSFKAMGIDRGVRNVLVHSVIDSPSAKPSQVRFWGGGELLHRRDIYEGIRKKFWGKKHVYRKQRKMRGKISFFTKTMAHKISREVVNEARKFDNIAIIMEDLRYIRETGRKVAGKKIEKETNKMLSRFIFGIIQNFIVYKSVLEGIPVVLIDPRGTSIQCNKCGYLNPANRDGIRFKCLKCGYQANADYNASVNIAKRFYSNLASRELTFDAKRNVFIFPEMR